MLCGLVQVLHGRPETQKALSGIVICAAAL